MSARHGPPQGKKSTVAWLVTLARTGYGVGLVAAPGLRTVLTDAALETALAMGGAVAAATTG
jgi:hypothetical protein